MCELIESRDCLSLIAKNFDAAYEQMARDETREAEALEWIEGVLGDVGNEPW